jgi:hypothetical protein
MASAFDIDQDESGDGQVAGKQPVDLLLCYLQCPTDAAGGFLGAALLTDYRARPQHFAYVQPVKPTKMQRILYGATLDEHIKVDVIAKKLWDGLPKSPDIVFVDSPDLLAVRRVVGVPTAFVAVIPDSEVNPTSLTRLRYDVGPNVADQSLVGQVIVTLEGSCNLIEPFGRIRQALTESLKLPT